MAGEPTSNSFRPWKGTAESPHSRVAAQPRHRAAMASAIAVVVASPPMS